MTPTRSARLDRRAFLGRAAALSLAGMAAPALIGSAAAQSAGAYAGSPPVTGGPGAAPEAGTTQYDPNQGNQRNISSFRMHDWRPFFDNTRNGVILVDLTSRALSFWSEDQTVFRMYPTSIPVSADLTRRGRTEIVRKVEGPTWSPTPEMKKRNPDWPDFVPAGPDNPLGTHALYLSWQYYRIHGTHDTRKIGRKSSNGCVGLYNEHIKELYGLTRVGTQVLLI